MRNTAPWKYKAACGVALALCMLIGTFSAHALTISPPIYEIGAAPGQSITTGLRVFNETSETSTWYFDAQDFTAKGTDGEPTFTGDGNTTDLASWIVLPPSPLTLGPGQSANVNFTINVPADADPGGHYAALFLDSAPPDTGAGAVGVASRIGSLILLRVAGDVIEKGSLQQFSLGSSFGLYAGMPVDFKVLFQNSGNVHVKPSGTITIKNLFGGAAGAVLVNEAKQSDGTIGPVGNVLPDSAREFDESWGVSAAGNGFWGAVVNEWDNFALGRYTADLHLTYGTEGETIDASLAFWIIPWQLLLIVLLIAVLLITLIIFSVRRYNAWIIRKAAGKS